MKIEVYDTTLRDGAQSSSISFTVEDKIKIAKELDNLCIDYIEGGWPGANIKDTKFFEKVAGIKFQHAKIVAFGSTRRIKYTAEDDPNLSALIKVNTDYVCIFGKSWDLHVKEALKIALIKNFDLITDSILFLKKYNKEVIYDAEHFFDGYKHNKEFALATIMKAQAAGAKIIVLCDTNGGCLPEQIKEIINQVKKNISIPLGIHCHNDSELAVANTLSAIAAGCVHIQGTINGYGERCGNANLCSLLPTLKFKLNISSIPEEKFVRLTEVARFVAEVANMPFHNSAAYVGSAAFSHKGGIHADAIAKNPLTYEHIQPEKVGNQRRILVSELAGKSVIKSKTNKVLDDKTVKKVLVMVKKLEEEGYQFEDADASFELLIRQAAGEYEPFFDLKSFRVIVEKDADKLRTEATIKLQIVGKEEYTVAEGDGPVHALDNALRKALTNVYPLLKEVRLTDYKVRVLDVSSGTAAKVRVFIESAHKCGSWGTVGVSENIIEASIKALIDSIEYVIYKHKEIK